MEYLWVGVGGFAGANVRYVLGAWIGNRFGAGFPYGTLLINVTGSLLIGVILTLLTEQLIVDPLWRRLLIIGFLGGYTTFSSYSYEALALVEQGNWSRALSYILGTNILSLLACYMGIIMARTIER